MDAPKETPPPQPPPHSYPKHSDYCDCKGTGIGCDCGMTCACGMIDQHDKGI
jgi:hypothetical protein